ncbi:MAG: aminoacyl-tRNA deacylase [Chloroflexota bacterium]
MSTRATRATEALTRAGVPFRVLEYEAPERHGTARDERPAYGREAAAALGVDEGRIFKTLVAVVDRTLALAIVPVAASLDLKRLADALGGRRADLADPAAAERATGYVIGGISPLGVRRRLPVILDAGAMAHATVLVSAGRRGLQVELAPDDLVRAAVAIVAPIARPV